jgi:hypothetical protein
LHKLLHDLVQNLNTLQKNLPTSQYELGNKCPHAEGLKDKVHNNKPHNEDNLERKHSECSVFNYTSRTAT